MSLVAAPLAGSSSRADLARPNADRQTAVASVACVGVCALVLLAPFEALDPLVTLPGQSLSTVEAGLVAALAVWAAALIAARAWPTWRAPLTRPWLAVLAAMLAAALAAPRFQANAIHMVGRLGLAFAVYLLVVNAVQTVSRLRAVLVAAATAGAVVASLAFLEYLGVEWTLSFLTTFRGWVALVGSQVRASGPLQYPTIASMFLEIAFAFALGLMLMAIDARQRAAAVVSGIVTALIAQGVVVTFTRSGLLTVGTTLAVVGGLRYRRAGLERGGAALAIVAALFAAQVLSSRSEEYLRLRLTTETMETWFQAEIDAPAELTLATGARSTVPVRLRNTGAATWDSSAPQPFQFSYHWLLANEDTVVVWEGLRTPFPDRVPPGSSVSLSALVEAPPEPGQYRLVWDIEQRHRLWFSTEPDAALHATRVQVAGPRVGTALKPHRMQLPANTVRPGRFVLWKTAADLFRSRPIFGVGPDNYRLLYGDRAGLTTFDRRVHANNMYLEILVGGGIVGGAAFAWLCWASARQVSTAMRGAGGAPLDAAIASLAAATLAIALHGLVDSFLSFTATYILIAITLGLTSASLALMQPNGPERPALPGTHAHRI
jgi:hypothetical protein